MPGAGPEYALAPKVRPVDATSESMYVSEQMSEDNYLKYHYQLHTNNDAMYSKPISCTLNGGNHPTKMNKGTNTGRTTLTITTTRKDEYYFIWIKTKTATRSIRVHLIGRSKRARAMSWISRLGEKSRSENPPMAKGQHRDQLVSGTPYSPTSMV